MNIEALLILCRIIMVLAERKTICYSSEPPRTGESVAFGPDTFWGTLFRRPSIFNIFGSSVPQQAHEDVQRNVVHRSHLQPDSLSYPVQETNEDAVHTSDETQPKEFCSDRIYEDDAETQPKGLYTGSTEPGEETTPKQLDRGSANPDEDTTPKEIDTAAMPERLGPDGDSNPSTFQQAVFSYEDESYSTDHDENT